MCGYLDTVVSLWPELKNRFLHVLLVVHLGKPSFVSSSSSTYGHINYACVAMFFVITMNSVVSWHMMKVCHVLMQSLLFLVACTFHVSYWCQNLLQRCLEYIWGAVVLNNGLVQMVWGVVTPFSRGCMETLRICITGCVFGWPRSAFLAASMRNKVHFFNVVQWLHWHVMLDEDTRDEYYVWYWALIVVNTYNSVP